MSYPDKDTPECRYCIFAAVDSISDTIECHRKAPLVYNSGKTYWPILDINDFCGKWRGVEKDYLDLFPKTKED